LVFLGDLIDRGKKNREVVNTVRALVDQGVAICLMGNHEFNAVQFHTPDGKGGYLREHSEKNIKQHQAFINDYTNHKDELAETIQWFALLPVAIETPNFRAIHACWSPNHLKNLRPDGIGWYMGDTSWVDAADENLKIYETIETLLKGPEKKLPNNLDFLDKDNERRKKVRLAWWKEHPKTWEYAVDPSVDLQEHKILEWEGKFLSYPPESKPIFFGHYWRTGKTKFDSKNAFCLDYSAGNGGHLTAYRFDAEDSSFEYEKIIQINVK
jgi:calcineurin-like phosphoesterase family protein